MFVDLLEKAIDRLIQLCTLLQDRQDKERAQVLDGVFAQLGVVNNHYLDILGKALEHFNNGMDVSRVRQFLEESKFRSDPKRDELHILVRHLSAKHEDYRDFYGSIQAYLSSDRIIPRFNQERAESDNPTRRSISRTLGPLVQEFIGIESLKMPVPDEFATPPCSWFVVQWFVELGGSKEAVGKRLILAYMKQLAGLYAD